MSDEARAAIGRVLGAFGLRGEVKVAAGDIADLRAGLAVVARAPDGAERSLTIESVRAHKNRALVRFVGIGDADSAHMLAGSALEASLASLAPLPSGTYRYADLVGLDVVDARLGALGTVTDVLRYPQADMLVVGPRALFIPMLAAYGVRVDLAARSIATSLPEGFEEL